MVWVFQQATIFFLLTLSALRCTSSVPLPTPITPDSSILDQAIKLSLLMDTLDRIYTPRCLRVIILSRDQQMSMNSTHGNPYRMPNNWISQASLTFSEKLMEDEVNGLAKKPSMQIILTGETIHQAREAINYINKETDQMTSFSCVTYFMTKPPDAILLPALVDAKTRRRITRYFLVHTQSSDEAEQFLLDQRMGQEENVAALVQEDSQNKSYWRVLIRQLFHPSGSPQVLTVNRWSRDTGLTNTENIFPEQMANFYGQTLKGVTLDYIPFVELKKTKGSLVAQYKPCVDKFIVDTLSQQLNFSYEIVMPADGQWGYINDKGHFVGIVGDIEFGRANFAFDLTVTLERAEHVDFTDYYFVDVVTFITAKSRSDPLWRKVITPLRGMVWLCVLASVVGGSLLYHIIYHAQATLTSSRLLSSRAFMHVLASFLSQSLYTCQSIHAFLSLQAGRIFLGFWLWYAFLVTTYYKTSLTSTLAVPFAPSTIDTLQELLQSDLSYGMKATKGAAYSLFSSSTIPLYRDMFDRMLFHSTEDNLRLVAEGQHSFIYFKGHLDLLVAMYNNNPERRAEIHMATEGFFPAGYGCAVPPGAPYLRTFNAVLKKCLQGGLITKWIRDSLQFFLKQPQEDTAPGDPKVQEEEAEKKPEESTREVVLNLNHLQGPFLILLMGCGGGAIILLIEILMAKRS